MSPSHIVSSLLLMQCIQSKSKEGRGMQLTIKFCKNGFLTYRNKLDTGWTLESPNLAILPYIPSFTLYKAILLCRLSN